jgi:hypothetical protein
MPCVILFPVLVCCTKKNLATLTRARGDGIVVAVAVVGGAQFELKK